MATDAMSEMVPVHRRPKDLEFEGGNFQSPAPKSVMKKRLKGFLNLLLNRNSTRHEETDMDFENLMRLRRLVHSISTRQLLHLLLVI